MKMCLIAASKKKPVARNSEADAVQEVANLILQQLDRGASFEDLELQTLEILRKVGREIVREELEKRNPDTKVTQFGGQLVRLALTSEKEYLSLFGTVQVRRSLYRTPGRNAATICPLEIAAGMVDAFWLPGAARLGAVAMADLSAHDAHRLFREIGLMCPSASSLGRLPTALSHLWEEHRELHEAMLHETRTIPSQAVAVCASVDGVMAPMKDKAAQRQVKRESAGKHGSGPSGYREIGCGTVSFHDDKGERLDTIYHGRMPEAKKATLHQQLEAEMLGIAAARPHLRRVFLADGAEINWQIARSIEAAVKAQCEVAETPYSAAVDIVDYYHACEHLKRALDAVFGEGTTQGKVEFQKLKAKLKESDQGVELVINALRYRSRISKNNSRLEAEVTYFRNQRARMDYAVYLRANLPIASGVVEAACKTLVTQRMKRSGMAWGQAGGQAILSLRSWLRSETFDAAWQIITGRLKFSSSPTLTYAEPRLLRAA